MDFIRAPGIADSLDQATFGLLIVLFVGLVLIWLFGSKIHRLASRNGPRRSYKKPFRAGFRRKASPVLPFRHPANPTDQLEFIAKVDFETRPLLNKEEHRVFLVLEEVVNEIGGNLRLMAQTSLGEVIQPTRGGSKVERDHAFSSINSKRLDFAVFNAAGRLVLAVEYQGSGHYHHKSFIRDAVKKEALRKAGVPFLEVSKGSTPNELRGQVRRLLSPPADASRDGGIAEV